jgi:hypothetical protein
MTGTDAGDGPKRFRSNARSGNRPASSSASMACASSAAQRLEGLAVGLTREQLIAVDQIGQRHRLLA